MLYFLHYIKAAPYSDALHKNLNEIAGVVIVDEVDSHLHTELQYKVLPNLISLFPKIQFILTTHSPLFLLGMKQVFKAQNFKIINMPDGEFIDPEMFSEFMCAYNAFQGSEKFQQDIKEYKGQMMIVEGITDVNYIKQAAKLLKKENLIKKIRIIDGKCCSELDKIWQARIFTGNDVSEKILLLYGCCLYIM